MREFTAAFGTDLQAVTDLLGELAVGEGPAGRGTDRQRGGDRVGHLVGGATSAPSQGRFALGVDGGDDQATDEADVGEEGATFVGLALRIRLVPEGMSAKASRHHAERERRRRQPRQLAAGQQQAAADLHGRVDAGHRLGVGRNIGADGVGQFAESLERRAGRVGGGLGAAQGIDAAGDEGR